jgi:putative oxidoreductase
MKAPEAPPAIVQMLVAWGELVGGIALAVGFLTRLAALGIAVIMAGAIATVHGQNGFGMINPGGFVNGLIDPANANQVRDGLYDLSKTGFEYNFALIVMCAAVILLGGGTLAADRILRVRPRYPEPPR